MIRDLREVGERKKRNGKESGIGEHRVCAASSIQDVTYSNNYNDQRGQLVRIPSSVTIMQRDTAGKRMSEIKADVDEEKSSASRRLMPIGDPGRRDILYCMHESNTAVILWPISKATPTEKALRKD